MGQSVHNMWLVLLIITSSSLVLGLRPENPMAVVLSDICPSDPSVSSTYEFIELKSGKSESVSLDNYGLLLIFGRSRKWKLDAHPTIELFVSLNGFHTSQSGMFVIGSPAVEDKNISFTDAEVFATKKFDQGK